MSRSSPPLRAREAAKEAATLPQRERRVLIAAREAAWPESGPALKEGQRQKRMMVPAGGAARAPEIQRSGGHNSSRLRESRAAQRTNHRHGPALVRRPHSGLTRRRSPPAAPLAAAAAARGGRLQQPLRPLRLRRRLGRRVANHSGKREPEGRAKRVDAHRPARVRRLRTTGKRPQDRRSRGRRGMASRCSSHNRPCCGGGGTPSSFAARRESTLRRAPPRGPSAPSGRARGGRWRRPGR